MLKVLIVDDSSFARKMVREMISTDPELGIVGEAEDGYQAVKMAKELTPDAIVLDLIMPNPDGPWIVENIFKEKPIPIVLFSSLVSNDSEIVENMFRQGVLDVIKKPENPATLRFCTAELISKIKAAAKSKATLENLYANYQLDVTPKILTRQSAKSAIAIIASAGSPGVLIELLECLSKKIQQIEMMDSAVLVALHMPHKFLQSFTKTVSKTISLQVNIAKTGDIIRKKNVFFSPGNCTLCFKKTRYGVTAKLEDLKLNMQPHFDTFLKSVAGSFQKNIVAVVLSGMGNHGLEGAATIKRIGGHVIVQDPSTAGVPAMPESVLGEGLADASLFISKMPDVILEKLGFLSKRDLSIPRIGSTQPTFRSKGIVFLGVKKFAESQSQDDGWKKILDSLSQEVRNMLPEPILPSLTYPQEAYVEVHQALAAHFGAESIEKAAEYTIEIEEKQVYSYSFKKTYKSILDTFINFPQMTNRISEGVKGEMKELDINNKKVVLEISGEDLGEKAAKIMFARLKGTFRKLLSMFEAADVSFDGKIFKSGQGNGVRLVVQWS